MRVVVPSFSTDEGVHLHRPLSLVAEKVCHETQSLERAIPRSGKEVTLVLASIAFRK
jgi:hypothetical protein